MTTKTISDFDTQISEATPFSVPTPEGILTDDDYKLASQLFSISAKYKTSDAYSSIPVTEMQSDCLAMQSLLVELTRRFGMLMSYAESIEEQLKIARSRIRIQSKNLKNDFQNQGHAVSITLDDLKDLSYVKTETTWKYLENTRIAAEFIRFTYFAARDQVNILNQAIERIHRFE